MAWSWKRTGASGHMGDAWSMEDEPEKKRRKVFHGQKQDVKLNEAGEDWGDDSLELTQADLETLDVMTSQVLSQVSSAYGIRQFLKS